MNDREEQTTPNVYLWFDSEFTSLEIEESHLLQVAMIATDISLQRTAPIKDDVNLFVQLPETVPVSEWTQQNIPQIIAQARSEQAVPVEQVDQFLVDWIQTHVGATPADIRQRPILAGNSIHADLAMIHKQLPRFAACLHYRMLDVSALKIMWQDAFTGTPFDKDTEGIIEQYTPFPLPAETHTRHDALFDIYASMAEYNYYCRHLSKTHRP